jgi:hypothetical protein
VAAFFSFSYLNHICLPYCWQLCSGFGLADPAICLLTLDALMSK